MHENICEPTMSSATNSSQMVYAQAESIVNKRISKSNWWVPIRDTGTSVIDKKMLEFFMATRHGRMKDINNDKPNALSEAFVWVYDEFMVLY